MQEIIRFDGLFKGFTFRANQPKKQPSLLSMLLSLPFIKAIEPDQLFYPEFATGVTTVTVYVFAHADVTVHAAWPVGVD